MAEERALAVPVRFYRTAGGAEPALEWLRSLDKADRHGIGLNLASAKGAIIYLTK